MTQDIDEFKQQLLNELNGNAKSFVPQYEQDADTVFQQLEEQFVKSNSWLFDYTNNDGHMYSSINESTFEKSFKERFPWLFNECVTDERVTECVHERVPRTPCPSPRRASISTPGSPCAFSPFTQSPCETRPNSPVNNVSTKWSDIVKKNQ